MNLEAEFYFLWQHFPPEGPTDHQIAQVVELFGAASDADLDVALSCTDEDVRFQARLERDRRRGGVA